MNTLLMLLLVSLVSMPVSSMASQKDKHDKKFPGEASGRFVIVPILAGALCTDPISQPGGMHLAIHGGPKKQGFIGGKSVTVVPLSEGQIPNGVQVCFVDGKTRETDVMVRISFKKGVSPE